MNRGVFFSSKTIKYVVTSIIAFSFGILSVGSILVEANEKQNQFSLSKEELEEASRRAKEMKSYLQDDGELIFDEDFLADVNNSNDSSSINLEDYINSDFAKTEDDSLPNTLEDAEDESLEEDTEKLESLEDEDLLEDVVEAGDNKNHPNKDDWRLILVNKQNPVPDGYEANLKSINGSQSADERIIEDILRMLDAASKDNVNLIICSAYRSYDRQTTLFNNKMNKLMAKGMSYMEAYTVGSMSVTVPGTSEHQLGLALDILTSSYLEMDDGFGDTDAGIWLAKNAPEYGFILRYPQGKEAITGIIYEPWHFRYVGSEYAKEITELDVTLEEYLNGDY